MTEDEKDRLLADAAYLLERGTSNSLLAPDRQRWNLERDRVVEAVRVELLQ